MKPKARATCTCGALAFESTEDPITQLICHCVDCRAATGEPFTTTAFFRTQSTRITGAMTHHAFVAASGYPTDRAGCARCGAVVFDTSGKFPGLTGVITRFLLPPFVANPFAHMWVSSQQSGVVVTDGLPQHAQGVMSRPDDA